MSIASQREWVKSNPRQTTAVLSVLGYVLVLGTFAGLFPFPEIARSTVNLLSDAIAVVNTTALALLIAGVYFIRQGDVRKHRAAMVTAFVLILVFLVLYLLKVGGGGEKEIVGPPAVVYYAYLAMLAIHVLLSVLAVPVVLHAIVLGLSHSPSELPNTEHPKVGRIAAAAWIVSLALGVITYLLLNHVYSYRFMGM